MKQEATSTEFKCNDLLYWHRPNLANTPAKRYYSVMDSKVFKVKSIGQGTLFIMPCPKPEQLEDSLLHLKHLGINKVVSLLEIEEAVHLGAANEGEMCKRLDMSFEQFPIRDRNIPKNPAKFRQLVNTLYEELYNGTSIAIHCYAGIGRTGLLAGGLMITEGISVGSAVELMSDARGRNMPQTQDQYEYLMDYAAGEEALEVAPKNTGNWFTRLFSTA
uniref:Protein tyrosine phosphatase n=1 Tax=uncultured Thiotrichaceae bacterium TaxID=298394 RepID=A0A6S6SKS1_9GAMM|nr:MAG: Protein tyrosine phosphatase [uncultured Thiotrichaceae bacterium]